VTVTVVVALPVAEPPVTTTLPVMFPTVRYVHIVDGVGVVKSMLPLLSQSQVYSVGVGAPLTWVTVAVKVALPATTTVRGDAASVTVYDGTGVGGTVGTAVTDTVVVALPVTVPPVTVTFPVIFPAVS
jgi:hypothetical protein